MTGNEIRKSFLDYFAERGHALVGSGSLVPQGDATLMFANAGMVQFKRVFTGEERRPYTRAATSQKCMRVSGKHNDLEEVGRSPSHHTFFEMLGNFSFGDYFKKGAIDFAWEFLTRVLELPPDELVVSVHKDDDEAYSLWRDHIGLDPRRIFKLGDDENFWAMGDTGPCGPCSEIHKITDRKMFEKGGDPSGPGFVELWNLVFMQFEQRADGSRVPLPKPSIDTGMGLERITRVLQGKSSTYDTDLFQPLLRRVSQIAKLEYGANPDSDVSMRVTADHARACVFLVGDGVLPSNEGRGYVLRRVLRRAARHGVLLGIDGPFLHEMAETVIDEMAQAYPDLAKRRAFVVDAIKKEEERFGKTLGRGLALLEEEVTRLRKAGQNRLSGEVMFKLYDTYGFPTDLTEDILRGKALSYDRAGFDDAMRVQAERARAAWKGSGAEAPAEVYSALAAQPTKFSGYESLETESKVRALLKDGVQVSEVAEGDRVEVQVEVTPFYAESGGQVGDVGSIANAAGRIEVEDVQKPVEGLVVHKGKVAIGRLAVGDSVTLSVDADARAATVRNHSGTHLLQWALRDVLGPQVTQAGSLVAPDRLRFDFTHDAPLTDAQVRAVEDRVNAQILANHSARVEQKSYREAIEGGAIAMFTEKYGDRVRVVTFGPSTELCGGTHARATGDIGSFRIVGQSAIGAGVRRIEAQTGFGALEHARRDARVVRDTAELLRTAPAELTERVTRLLERERELEKELEKTRAQLRRGGSASDPMASVREVGGVKLLAREIEDANPKELRTLVDELKQRIGSGIVLLGVRHEGKAALALGVTPDLVGRFKAGDLVRELAKEVGGTGGGRPDFAQAGGPEADKLGAALEKLPAVAGLAA